MKQFLKSIKNKPSIQTARDKFKQVKNHYHSEQEKKVQLVKKKVILESELSEIRKQKVIVEREKAKGLEDFGLGVIDGGQIKKIRESFASVVKDELEITELISALEVGLASTEKRISSLRVEAREKENNFRSAVFEETKNEINSLTEDLVNLAFANGNSLDRDYFLRSVFGEYSPSDKERQRTFEEAERILS